MSQISYKVEIIGMLLRESNHIRGLAKDLKTNQMTISRKIKELEEENVVDFKQEGKNKKYFLKQSIEAKEHIFTYEHYKLLQTIEKYPSLKLIFQKIRENSKVKLALLFGSYSKYSPNKNSDIDIYIETTSQELKEEVAKISSKISIKIGKYDKNNLLIKEINKNHVIIKGVEEYYEKIKLVSQT